MSSQPRRRDAGSGPVTALLVMGILALFAAMVLTGRFSIAGDERSNARHAADAAALAGAQAVLDAIPDEVQPGFLSPTDVPILLGGSRCMQTGSPAAERLASENGATLTSYCYDVYTDEITTAVRMNASRVKSQATAGATAATTFKATGCSVDVDFHAPTKPAPGDDATPPPASALTTSIDCGINPLPVVYDPADSRFRFVGLAEILARVDPRLTR